MAEGNMLKKAMNLFENRDGAGHEVEALQIIGAGLIAIAEELNERNRVEWAKFKKSEKEKSE